jgi:hypothetical protein
MCDGVSVEEISSVFIPVKSRVKFTLFFYLPKEDPIRAPATYEENIEICRAKRYPLEDCNLQENDNKNSAPR